LGLQHLLLGTAKPTSLQIKPTLPGRFALAWVLIFSKSNIFQAAFLVDVPG